MGTNVIAEVTGYEVHVEPLFDVETEDGETLYSREQLISVKAKLSTSAGQELGLFETDVFTIARNVPLGLVKAYLLNRKIEAGKLVPEIEL